MRVDIHELSGGREVHEYTVDTTDERDAIAAAVQAQYGRGAAFRRNLEMPSEYGAITKPSGQGERVVVGRVRIDTFDS